MKKLTLILITLLVLALVVTAIGCGGDDDEETTPTPARTVTVEPTATGPGATATPEPPVYTGGKHTFKLSHTGSLDTLGQRRAEYIDERLRYYTDGKVKLEIYPGASLYGAFEMWDALVTGALDMAFMNGYQFQMQGFDDYTVFWFQLWWGETMETAGEHNDRFWAHPDGGRKLFAQVEDRGLKMFSHMPNSIEIWMVQDFSVKSIWDFKGKKSMGSPGLGGLFLTRAGASLVIVDPAEFYMAFQQGLVDSYPTGASGIVTNRLWDDACCAFVLDVINVNTFFTMSMDLWDSLEPELQDIIENKITPEVFAWTGVEVPKDRDESYQEVLDHGMEVVFIDPQERLDFRDACWEMTLEQGYLDLMDLEMVKLADRLRSEPYDTGYFFP